MFIAVFEFSIQHFLYSFDFQESFVFSTVLNTRFIQLVCMQIPDLLKPPCHDSLILILSCQFSHSIFMLVDTRSSFRFLRVRTFGSTHSFMKHSCYSWYKISIHVCLTVSFCCFSFLYIRSIRDSFNFCSEYSDSISIISVHWILYSVYAYSCIYSVPWAFSPPREYVTLPIRDIFRCGWAGHQRLTACSSTLSSPFLTLRVASTLSK